MMKTLDLDGISYIQPVPGGTGEWYYGISYEQGDLYEAEEIFRAGGGVTGRKLCLVRYPDGAVFRPVPKVPGRYPGEPVFYQDAVWFLDVDFPAGLIRIMRFDTAAAETEVFQELPLSLAKDCYNLRLDPAPLTLTRQSVGENEFEILWPERTGFHMDDHESFFLRDGDRLYFNHWYENDTDYWEETVVRDLSGGIVEQFSGDVMVMPNGERWLLR